MNWSSVSLGRVSKLLTESVYIYIYIYFSSKSVMIMLFRKKKSWRCAKFTSVLVVLCGYDKWLAASQRKHKLRISTF